VQLRLADFKFEQAQTLGEVQNQHAVFIETFNTTSHWAHRHRGTGSRTPVDVLGWLRGRHVEPKRLRGVSSNGYCCRNPYSVSSNSLGMTIEETPLTLSCDHTTMNVLY
jgi:hypothetical protein